MKTVGVQIGLKPIDRVRALVGYMVGPEQPDSIRCLAGTTLDAASATCVASATSTSDVTFAVPGANRRLRHLADVVVDATPIDRVRVLFNADFGTEELPSARARWYGANVTVGYALDDRWSLALRGEWFRDDHGLFTPVTGARTTIVDGTLTVGASPTKHLLLKLDLRADRVDVEGVPEGVFVRGSGVTTKLQPTATLGVVATTN